MWNDFKPTVWCSRFFLIMLARKFMHGFWTGFLRSVPGAQIAMVSLFNIGYVIALAFMRPYKSTLQGFIECIAYSFVTLNYLLTFGLLPQISVHTKLQVASAIAAFSILAVVSQFSTIVYRVILIFTEKAKVVPKVVRKAQTMVRKSIHTLRGKYASSTSRDDLGEEKSENSALQTLSGHDIDLADSSAPNSSSASASVSVKPANEVEADINI